jgi:hypothetical protein
MAPPAERRANEIPQCFTNPLARPIHCAAREALPEPIAASLVADLLWPTKPWVGTVTQEG